MASSNVKLQVRSFIGRLEKALDVAISQRTTRAVAEEAIKIIVRRTRLGYGVAENYGTRYRLPPLSSSYIEQRRRSRELSSTTAPRKSNLTFTGQMLESVSIIKINDRGNLSIEATGKRRQSKLTNLQVARFNAANGRVFNKLSRLEFQQLIRFYRKSFGDLLQKLQLLK